MEEVKLNSEKDERERQREIQEERKDDVKGKCDERRHL